MTLGKGDEWLPNYRSLEERLRPHIIELVPVCSRTLGKRLQEDEITRNLVVELINRSEVRKFASVEYQFVPFRSDAHGNWAGTGRIDIAVFPCGNYRRDAYLAIECKCLNVTTNQGRRSRARRYVVSGVHRFVNEQYSEDLPLGAMLGYVVDGHVKIASAKVRRSLSSKAALIGLVHASSDIVARGSSIQFETTHDRETSKTTIRLTHLLVSCI